MSASRVTSGEEALRAEVEAATAAGQVRHEVPGLTRERAWSIFADTDVLNRAIGSPEIELENVPVRAGVSRRLFTTREATPVRYEEEYYQWEEGRWVGGRRFFREIPLEKFVFLFTLAEIPGGMRADMRVGFWGRGAEGAPVAAAVAESLCSRLRGLAERLHEAARVDLPRAVLFPSGHASRLDLMQLRAVEKALVACGEDPGVVSRLVQRLETADDSEVSRMGPLALARAWATDPDRTIDAFVRGARLGALDARWSVACPSCRGRKGSTHDVCTLAAREVHCEDCNLSFAADPARNLTLEFAPAPRVRRVEESFACVGAPTRTPHVKAQVYLEPGETCLVVHLPAARPLRMTCPDVGAEIEVHGPDRFRLDHTGVVRVAGEAPDRAVVVENATAGRIRIRVEDREMPDTFLRASEVLARPRFRELFGADQWEFLCAMDRAWHADFGRPSERSVPDAGPYDLVVVGAGPGGEAAALRAAQLGKRVAIVEARPQFGGPSGLASKAMREVVRKILVWAEAASDESPSSTRRQRIEALFEQRFALLRRYLSILQTQEVLRGLARAGVALHRGVASFDDGGALNVAPETGPAYRLDAPYVVLATGSRPARPSSVPFDGIRVLDAAEMGALERLPRTACVIGGGIIGCEFATLLAALGTKVTLLANHRPFPYLDEELARDGIDLMRRSGIDLRRDVRVDRIAVAGDRVEVRLQDGTSLAADVALWAEGREAETAGLRCERAGVSLGKYGRIVVDEGNRTSNPAMFAVGDVVGPPGLASTAAAQGRAVAERLFGVATAAGARQDLHPTTLWTFPELAAVGLTEEGARAQSIPYVVGRASFRDLPRGILGGMTDGWLKVLAHPRDRVVLGIHILGEGACELVHYGRALIEARTPLDDVARTGFSSMTFHAIYQVAAEDALLRLARPV